MTCFRYSTIESSLRPCGISCHDLKSRLISTSESQERYLLQMIFEKLYFGDNPEQHQKKCTIWIEKNILTDRMIHLVVHIDGDNNLEMRQLFAQSRNYVEDFGFIYSIFGRMKIILMPYNKCFCDHCLCNNLAGLQLGNRVIVFEDFILSMKHPLSLMEAAITSLLPRYECCQINLLRAPFLWLGDGIDPISSACKLSTPKLTIQDFTTFTGIVSRNQRSPSLERRFTRSMKERPVTLTWDQLPSDTPYLLLGIYKQQLYLFTLGSYIILAQDYPRRIERFFIRTSKFPHDLVFITKTNHRFCMRTFDLDYQVEEEPIWG